jgi:hypothetical protein
LTDAGFAGVAGFALVAGFAAAEAGCVAGVGFRAEGARPEETGLEETATGVALGTADGAEGVVLGAGVGVADAEEEAGRVAAAGAAGVGAVVAVAPVVAACCGDPSPRSGANGSLAGRRRIASTVAFETGGADVAGGVVAIGAAPPSDVWAVADAVVAADV